MAAPSAKQVEDYLQKIRRLPSNKLCANCRVPSRLGFSAVCVKYQSFVCDMCKSSHQSFSHRTKSVTMSTWSIEEVRALDEKYGGGNEWCRAKWFAKMSESEAARYMPKEGDPLDNYKKFVHMVYEESKWYDENGKPAASASAVSVDKKPLSSKTAPIPKKTPPQVSSAKPKAEEDLLILDFESSVTVSSSSSTPTPPAVAVSASADEWGAFTTSSPQLTASKPTSSLSDDWTFQAAPPVASSPTKTINLQQLYQPQSTHTGMFPNMMQPQNAPFGAPLTTFPSTGMTMAQIPKAPISAGFPMASNVLPPSNGLGAFDPFSGLQSHSSAPNIMMNRSSSTGTSNGVPQSSVMPSLARATSAPTAHDPFAGLI